MEVWLPQTMLQKLILPTSRDCNSKYHLGSKGCHDLYPHRLSQPTCVDWSISRDLLSADSCGELPELLETDAERSTGVPLLSAAESTAENNAKLNFFCQTVCSSKTQFPLYPPAICRQT